MATVYGISKPMNDSSMTQEPECPVSVARAVYKALVSGTKLPRLQDSDDLREALLFFEVQSQPPDNENSDIINGNKGEGKGEDLGERRFPRRSSPEPSNNKAGPSKEDRPRKKSPRPSELMLEALSRRRMDAVRQLHEVCPQLLASIPLFDPGSTLDPGSPDVTGSAVFDVLQSQSTGVPVNCNRSISCATRSISPASSFTLTPNTCQVLCSSRLLDLAAENQTLLVFVLQHHPQVNKQPQQQQQQQQQPPPKSAVARTNGATKSTAAARAKAKKCDNYDSFGSAYDVCRNDLDARPAPAQKTDESKKREGNESLPGCSKSEGKMPGEDELETEGLDPNNAITICIRKNNIRVLQYLLFKHVWQHFLLDEVYNLPHTSIVSEVMLGEWLHSCPDCPWFLHCAALMGCPRLLQLLLSGHFCNHSMPPTPEVSFQFTDKKNSKSDEDSAPKCMQTVPEDREFSSTSVKPSLENTDSETVSKQILSVKSLETSNVKNSDTGLNEECSQSGTNNVTDLPLSTTSPDVSMTTPSSSTANVVTNASVSPGKQKKKVFVSGKPPDSRWVPVSGRQSASLFIPDPNRQLPVSLPVMDRWISRCMHVRLAPLHLACWRCDPASVKVLLSHGADARLLAEELPSPDTAHSSRGSHPTDSGSAQSSSVELSLNFVSVTVNTSSLDLGTKCSSMEELLKRAGGGAGSDATGGQQGGVAGETGGAGGGGGGGGGGGAGAGGLTTLAMLALGIRSPPDFSLSIGKSLGLVLPTVPELWGGQVDRSCHQARLLLMESLRLLLDAGSDVNASSLVFGKTYRVMELFLQPSVDLYYAPLMPRGGRDSAVLRCMDLERVAEIVLSACWELCFRGGSLGPCFASSMEWNLFRMDWMFLQNENLQRRFLHLAVFLGLFPPLDPDHVCTGRNHHHPCNHPQHPHHVPHSLRHHHQHHQHHFYSHHSQNSHHSHHHHRHHGTHGRTSSLTGEESQSSVSPTVGGTDLRDPLHPPQPQSPTQPARSAGMSPWASSSGRSGSSQSTAIASPVGSEDEVTTAAPRGMAVVASTPPQDLQEVVTSYYSAMANQAGPAAPALADGNRPRDEADPDPDPDLEPPGVVTPPISPAHFDCSPGASSFRARNPSSSSPCLPTARTRCRASAGEEAESDTADAEGVPGPASPANKAQRIRWGLEERQRRCLEKFVNEAVRLSMPPSSLALVMRFLCMSDLHMMARITQHLLQTSGPTTENPLQRVRDAASQAQMRTLQHSCKLVTLQALSWKVPAVMKLPLPHSLQRYLLDPY